MHPFLPRFVALATFKMPETGYTKTVGYDKILTTDPENKRIPVRRNKRTPAGQKREKYEDHFLWHP
jgi:hypothetical protein